jgi:hypothetical protein
MEFGGQPLILPLKQMAEQRQAGGGSRQHNVQNQLKKKVDRVPWSNFGHNPSVKNRPGRTNFAGTSQDAVWDYRTGCQAAFAANWVGDTGRRLLGGGALRRHTSPLPVLTHIGIGKTLDGIDGFPLLDELARPPAGDDSSVSVKENSHFIRFGG